MSGHGGSKGAIAGEKYQAISCSVIRNLGKQMHNDAGITLGG